MLHSVALAAGFRLRAMLVHEVFDKVLYLTPSARAQFSSGRIFNLVTTDAETLQMLFQNILGVISSPARIIGSMAMLYVQLGPSSLVALAVLILMMPAQVHTHPPTQSPNSGVIGRLNIEHLLHECISVMHLVILWAAVCRLCCDACSTSAQFVGCCAGRVG